MSGHVPPEAIDLFLERLFGATAAQDYGWIATISTERALEDLKSVQAVVTQHYEIVGGDDLGETYDRLVRFDSGAVLAVGFSGKWPCPDFHVTEKEVFERITLTWIEKWE